jgi:exopolysaccharide biosynthesis polyprenyl glycosylphosphotransferase
MEPLAQRIKGLADRVAAGLLLLVLSPLLLIIAVAIKLDSRGSILYSQNRVGQAGKLFRILKFRTMVTGAEHYGLGLSVAADDDRITRVGRLLRRLSLDELPQLFNVLAGHMSIVGPRPTLLDQVERYTPRQALRLRCKPGITGWAQVSGRNSISWEKRIELDIWYIEHWSLWLDLRIIARTPRALVDTEGVYGQDGVTKDLGEE